MNDPDYLVGAGRDVFAGSAGRPADLLLIRGGGTTVVAGDGNEMGATFSGLASGSRGGLGLFRFGVPAMLAPRLPDDADGRDDFRSGVIEPGISVAE